MSEFPAKSPAVLAVHAVSSSLLKMQLKKKIELCAASGTKEVHDRRSCLLF